MFSFLNNISQTELLMIALILLILFGANFMVQLARTSGETVKELKKIKKEFNDAIDETSSKTA